MESAESRQRLFWDSITCTLQNPVFSIGPGQFPTYEGRPENRGTGIYWKNPHNSFMQVGSECGIPALLLYLAGIGSTMGLFKNTGRHTSVRPDLDEITSAMFCMRLAMVGFCSATFFLNFSYLFYLPAMAGLAIAAKSASQELLCREP